MLLLLLLLCDAKSGRGFKPQGRGCNDVIGLYGLYRLHDAGAGMETRFHHLQGRFQKSCGVSGENAFPCVKTAGLALFLTENGRIRFRVKALLDSSNLD